VRLATVIRIVVQRSAGNTRLLTTVVIGVVFAAALMSSVIIYSDAIRDLGLRYALRHEPREAIDLRVAGSAPPGARNLYDSRRQEADSQIRAATADVLRELVHFGRTATFYPTDPGEPVSPDDSRPRANLQFLEDLDDHVRLVEGRKPNPGSPAVPGQAPSIEVWMGAWAAAANGLSIGQVLQIHPFWRLEQEPVSVTITGFFEPIDPAEQYWRGLATERLELSSASWQTYLFFVDEAVILDVVAPYLPDMDMSVETLALLNTGRINSRNAGTIEGRVRWLGTSLPEAIPNARVTTSLPDLIASYREKLFFTRLPLFALMLQIAGIVLYYLVMISTMLVERQTGEIALLKSRGASTGQVMAVYAIEGLFLCLVGVLLGPLLAAAAISILGFTPAFDALSGGSLLEVTLSRAAFGLALVGVLLAFAALLWPAYRATSHSIVHYKQNLARPPQQPIFLRYYLDLVLVGAGAYAFYQLRQRGSLVTERLFGDLSADPLLLVAPTLFMLMIALVFLRLFPIALRAASWLGRGLNGPTIPLGLWHMVRSPLHYSRLILLLLLATAVGMFAAGFRATLERSYDDRAAYEAGANTRLAGVSSPVNLPAAPYAARIAAATGAENVVPVARLDGSYSDGPFRYQSVTVLGVVPEGFEEVAFWRDDFASRSLGDLMEGLQEPLEESEPGPEVPTDARFIGLWAKMEPVQVAASRNVAGPGVRLRDADGALWEYRLVPQGAPRDDGWQFFAADLARPVQQRALQDRSPLDSASLRLESIYIRFVGNPQRPEQVTILLDELQVADTRTPDGFPASEVIEPFETLNLYETIAGSSPNTEPAQLSRAEGDVIDGQYAARLVFTREPAGSTLIGLQVTGAAQTIPIVASTSFLDYADKGVGDEIVLYINRQYVSVRVVGSFRYFPTYEPNENSHLVVADLEALQVVAARLPYLSDGLYPNEAWIGDAGPLELDREALNRSGVSASSIFDRAALREEKGSDPLIAASWEGILFLSFASVLLLTALGLIVYTYLTAQARSLEFAILRTMGFSGRQILALVSFEQLFVIVAGIGAGTLLGMPLGRLMVGYIGFDEGGGEVFPPLLSRISWSTVATVYGLLGLVFIGTILSLALMYSRLAVHRALRMGEL